LNGEEDKTSPPDDESASDLNAAERSIVGLLHRDALVEDGPHDDAQIADELSLTQEAVRAHLRSLYEKLRLPRLTEAERRVVIVLCRPLRQNGGPMPATNRQVANAVFLAEDTVKGHLRALYEKFGLGKFSHNEKRARLAERILQSGLLSASTAPTGQVSEPDPHPLPAPDPHPLLPRMRQFRDHRAIPVVVLAMLAAGVLLVVGPPWDVSPMPGASPTGPRPACSDREDNDADGKTNYPEDRGCSSPEDRTEKDAPCSDGDDNDADGRIDYPDDSGCASSEDWTEK
jgi:DNA-binding CsgD family transcriptional regulator